jgi:hypothetical protein
VTLPTRATTPPGDVCAVRLRHKKSRQEDLLLPLKKKNTALALHASTQDVFHKKKLVRKINSALSPQVRQAPIGDCIYCRLPTRCTP